MTSRENQEYFSSFNPYRPTLCLARGTNQQFYCTGVIIYNNRDNYFVVSAGRQTFLGFEMTANLRDTSPLRLRIFRSWTPCRLCRCWNASTVALTFSYFYPPNYKGAKNLRPIVGKPNKDARVPQMG